MKQSPTNRLACVALGYALVLAAASIAGATERAPGNAVQPNAVSCKLIRTAAQLQAMRNDLAATYCLANNIDLSSIANFTPVGDGNTPFTGNFFGNNHIIRNLTIRDTTHFFIGLFGIVSGGTIRDVTLVNVDIRATAEFARAGGLVGVGTATIINVGVSGTLTCDPLTNSCGGIAGQLSDSTVANSWSSADITGSFDPGGLVGFAAAARTGTTISDSFATGNISCSNCFAGGLAALTQGPVIRSFATGTVTGSGNSLIGGLVSSVQGSISQSFASGAVSGGDSSTVGGLVSQLSGTVDQSFSIGRPAGGANATVGGLVAGVFNGGTVTNSYWDTDTSGVAASALGVGLTTRQLRAALPAGFDPARWAINGRLSYPFLNDGGTDFTPQLATLVVNAFEVATLLPISQLDASQYRTKPLHADQASLATVYTMIARGIGFHGLKIDRFFWHDATQATSFAGPVTKRVKLGAGRSIAATANLNAVVDVLKTNRLAILRGSYTDAKGATGTHFMLATLFTRNGPSVSTIVANDPWTGQQVEIDPVSKTVLSPDFPLANFKVNAFQPVALLPPN